MKKVSRVCLLVIAIMFAMILQACGVSMKDVQEIQVEFIVDGEVYSVISTHGKVLKVPDDPVKEGEVFDGWYCDEGEWNVPLSLSAILDMPLSNDAVLRAYAKWKSNMVQTETETLEDKNNVVNSEPVPEPMPEPEPEPESESESGLRVIDGDKCGENVTWTLYEGGLLVFSGTGDMDEYYTGASYSLGNILIPWNTYATRVKTIVVEEGITSICNFAFIGCSFCTSIEIPESVTKLGNCAFEYCYKLESLFVPKSVNEIGSFLFHSCSTNVYYAGSKADFENVTKRRVDNADWDTMFEGKWLCYSETESKGTWHYVDGVPKEW